jgi:hypothetical protein
MGLVAVSARLGRLTCIVALWRQEVRLYACQVSRDCPTMRA